MTHPEITPDQAAHVLRILGEWTKRGWWYYSSQNAYTRPGIAEIFSIQFTNPDRPADQDQALFASGIDHFDALCQATTVMQVLLEEHPEKP